MAAIVIASSVFAHDRTDTIKVYGGKCDACKQQIKQALKVDGVKNAEWNAKTQLLIISYTTHSIRNIDIQRKLADAGFDTEKVTASDNAYCKAAKVL